MNREDVKSMGWQERQRVTVRGDAGELSEIEIIYGEIKKGAALMFYPEVNAIFRAKIDPRSGTPAFKRVPVVVY
jgi:anaerobic selenocysteine-containing dehydrogenase